MTVRHPAASEKLLEQNCVTGLPNPESDYTQSRPIIIRLPIPSLILAHYSCLFQLLHESVMPPKKNENTLR